MPRISDALELLTAQHDEIEEMLAGIAATPTARRPSAIIALADRITVHLAVEQELFYPAIAGALSPDVHQELLAEHVEIKRVLAELLWLDHDDERVARALARLTDLFATHATWQEHALFETVAETRTAEDLAALGSEMSAWVDGLVADDAVAA